MMKRCVLRFERDNREYNKLYKAKYDIDVCEFLIKWCQNYNDKEKEALYQKRLTKYQQIFIQERNKFTYYIYHVLNKTIEDCNLWWDVPDLNERRVYVRWEEK